MEIQKFIRLDVRKMLVVTKEELETLVKKYPIISVSEIDKNTIKSAKSDEVVGAIAGTITYLDSNSENPQDVDLWFVSNNYINSNFKTKNLTFGVAIEYAKAGFKIARTGWNGKDMFVFLVPGSKFKVSRHPLLGIYPEGTEITYRPHLDIKTADGSIATWAPSGSDALANDWYVVTSNKNEEEFITKVDKEMM